MNPMLASCIVLLCALLSTGWAAIDEDLVTDLPGLDPQPKFKHYSGYLNATGTRKLHYWFVESQRNPSSDPVVLWLNGGPGCSSLDGLLNENGPFRVVENGLVENPYSWNLVANVLYLEAPAGVGFSYMDGNVTTSDNQTALDNHQALKDFMAHYPEFSHQEFYLTGESYGGIYIPTLAMLIMEDSTFNFTGFAVGNGLHDYNSNDNTMLFFYYYHGLMSSESWDRIRDECCQGNLTDCDIDAEAQVNQKCETAVIMGSILLEDINPYDLYGDCYTEPSSDNDARKRIPPFEARPFSNLPSNRKKFMEYMSMPKSRLALSTPCIDDRNITNYLRRPDVRQALHIPQNVPAFDVCSADVGNSYQRQYETVKSLYLSIISKQKYRILVYHGDTDMVCNFLGGEYFVDDLKLQPREERHQWHYTAEDGSTQVAGFMHQFANNVTFVTVKGAGHMVPQIKPIPALRMFTNFLNGYHKTEFSQQAIPGYFILLLFSVFHCQPD